MAKFKDFTSEKLEEYSESYSNSYSPDTAIPAIKFSGVFKLDYSIYYLHKTKTSYNTNLNSSQPITYHLYIRPLSDRPLTAD